MLSLTGPYDAHETIRHCRKCEIIYKSQSLLQVVPTRCNVSYEVLVSVGYALFLRCRTIDEVVHELARDNIHISASEVGYLGRNFIHYLARAHQHATPNIKSAMNVDGGYILHLDATHGGGDSPALLTGIDGLSKFVLSNRKIPSESAEHIEPFLLDLKRDFGVPIACVHDMGKGICRAVENIFPNNPDYICHFHFLRDIGKDFLDDAYGALRSRLRHYKITGRLRAFVREWKQTIKSGEVNPATLAQTLHEYEQHNAELSPLVAAYALAEWALQGKTEGNGYGFPFDRPLLCFAERILSICHKFQQFQNAIINENNKLNKPLRKLIKEISKVANDEELVQSIVELRWRVALFDQLREGMAIAPLSGKKGLNENGANEDMISIEKKVLAFRNKLDKDPMLKNDNHCIKMVRQINKYNKKLFADPITVTRPQGAFTIYPQRTNNILEQFFRGVSRWNRRKTGNNSINRLLQTMLSNTPLVYNLKNPRYLSILLNEQETLEELFAYLDQKQLGVFESEEQACENRILPGFKSLICMKALPDHIIGKLKNVG